MSIHEYDIAMGVAKFRNFVVIIKNWMKRINETLIVRAIG